MATRLNTYVQMKGKTVKEAFSSYDCRQVVVMFDPALRTTNKVNQVTPARPY